MSQEIIAAFIGVAGAAVLAAIGWLVKQGKVIFTIKKWEHETQTQDSEGGFVECQSKEEASLYSYVLKLEIYNSSSEAKAIRDLRVVFRKDGKALFSDEPSDDATRRVHGSVSFCNKVSAINVEPKSVATVRLHGCIWKTDDRFSKLWDMDEVVLFYKYGKDHNTVVPIARTRMADDCLS